jgi:hypothetical protein
MAAARRPAVPLFLLAVIPAAVLAAAVALPEDHSPHCKVWAAAGECKANAPFMEQTCAKACQEAPPTDRHGEMEQCAGWAAQGECTRNPAYMMKDCPKNCAEQRASMHEGLLDDGSTCLDDASPARCARDAQLRGRCAGSCAVHELCAAEADAPECERALRCRELKDDAADCAALVEAQGCEAASSAHLWKKCYLSCARVDQAGLLRRFRLKYPVRTRKHGLLDEDGSPARPWRDAGRRALEAPCWVGTPFDEPPAATCESGRARLVLRWRRLGHARCRSLAATTPRPPPRRRLRLPGSLQPAAEPALAPLVEPLLLAPKVRMVRGFLTAEEAAHVIRVGGPGMFRSLAGGRQESIRAPGGRFALAQRPTDTHRHAQRPTRTDTHRGPHAKAQHSRRALGGPFC